MKALAARDALDPIVFSGGMPSKHKLSCLRGSLNCLVKSPAQNCLELLFSRLATLDDYIFKRRTPEPCADDQSINQAPDRSRVSNLAPSSCDPNHIPTQLRVPCAVAGTTAYVRRLETGQKAKERHGLADLKGDRILGSMGSGSERKRFPGGKALCSRG